MPPKAWVPLISATKNPSKGESIGEYAPAQRLKND